eukprot:8262344-Alexandrium_andersonii.AAC.1
MDLRVDVLVDRQVGIGIIALLEDQLRVHLVRCLGLFVECGQPAREHGCELLVGKPLGGEAGTARGLQKLLHLRFDQVDRQRW